MTIDRQTFAIVGGGLAGAAAVETLREHGFEGRVVLIGSESELPCERLADPDIRVDALIPPGVEAREAA